MTPTRLRVDTRCLVYVTCVRMAYLHDFVVLARYFLSLAGDSLWRLEWKSNSNSTLDSRWLLVL